MSKTGKVGFDAPRTRPGPRQMLVAALAAAFPLAAWSQDAQQLQRVEITGSSIKRIDAETALPVQVITREQIQKSGATNAEQLLQTVAPISSSGGNVTSASSGATTGSISSISLHGLTSLRTLVLLNGRRIAPYGIGFTGDSVSVDVNSIPLAAIERVEVLKDGASAVYGSDAIAGVVNFILRQEFKGIELSGEYGDTTRGGASFKRASGIFGLGNLASDRYKLMLTASYRKEGGLFGRDRDFASSGINSVNDTSSGNTFPANIAALDGSFGSHNPSAPGGCLAPYSTLDSNFHRQPLRRADLARRDGPGGQPVPRPFRSPLQPGSRRDAARLPAQEANRRGAPPSGSRQRLPGRGDAGWLRQSFRPLSQPAQVVAPCGPDPCFTLRAVLPLCLIIAADATVAPALNREFDSLGFKPYTVDTFVSALGLIRQWQFDALIVDGDGYGESLVHALPELRDRSNAPIVLLWSDAGERRQIEALQGGATEIIVKPASPRLIAAKLHRLIEIAKERPAAGSDERRSVVRLGALRLDPRRAAASVGDAPLALTTEEFELLLLLASRPGEFVHRDTIARALGSPTSGTGEGRRSADMHICRIRKKLRDAGAHSLRVETVYGRGYCLRLVREEAEELFAARLPAMVRLSPAAAPRQGDKDRGAGRESRGSLSKPPRIARSPVDAGRRVLRSPVLHQARDSVGHWRASAAASKNQIPFSGYLPAGRTTTSAAARSAAAPARTDVAQSSPAPAAVPRQGRA